MTGNSEQGEIRIFIIDDHLSIRTVVGKLIRRTPGLTLCGEAASAEEALARIPASRPQVVLVDLSLPGMDGIELIRRLQKSHPHLLTLAVSGYLEGVYGGRALQAGARGYLIKNELIDLAEAVQHIAGGGIYLSKKVRAILRSPPSSEEK